MFSRIRLNISKNREIVTVHGLKIGFEDLLALVLGIYLTLFEILVDLVKLTLEFLHKLLTSYIARKVVFVK